MADLVEDAVAAIGGVAKLTPAQVNQAQQLGHDEWTEWLSGGQPVPYSVVISRVRRMMAVTKNLPTQAALTSTLGVTPANARKIIRELLGTEQARQQLLATSLKGAKKAPGAATTPQMFWVTFPDSLRPEFDSRLEDAEAKLGVAKFVMPSRKDRTRPNQQTWELTEDVLKAII